jgi:hypothetical protein
MASLNTRLLTVSQLQQLTVGGIDGLYSESQRSIYHFTFFYLVPKEKVNKVLHSLVRGLVRWLDFSVLSLIHQRD